MLSLTSKKKDALSRVIITRTSVDSPRVSLATSSQDERSPAKGSIASFLSEA